MIRNNILQRDIDEFYLPPELADELRESTIIVTGATGLIGAAFVRCINALRLGVKFILPVRNYEKAKALFDNESEMVRIIECELTDFFRNLSLDCDYIIHCASPTNGKFMCSHPAETFFLPIESTRELLDFCLRRKEGHPIKGIVYLSSIEYYGQISDNDPVRENDARGYIDRKSPRSSYALGKQCTEYLGYCYASEYGIPFRSARLTQTFGAGIPEDDNRVFAQFARSVIEGRDIVLHTEGLSSKPYCYTTDCISAIVYILLKGENGESYNVASPDTYISILELANLYRKYFNQSIEVKVEPLKDSGYAPVTLVNLNSDRLRALGWYPRYGLPEMLDRLIKYMKEEKQRGNG